MSFIQVETPRPHITLVTLNRPERMNAMAFDVMVPFRDALQEISLDNDCRVVVITGAGHGFCSGADLIGPLHDRPEAPESQAGRSWLSDSALSRRISRCDAGSRSLTSTV